ncbi:DNA replication complex GINS protein PSF1 [Desmophyllum pertusum]|uniref:DNA replication complex GINS protein PSF1 n=1 Tax=Desmophyllum pertusum TaxID=174260 RepID=A0A9X0CKH6_9CNID|nr:DNA replication complex GINS protein PSF1 [Desmophyllum pertusum]
MFGDKALELVKELKRSMDGTLPPYNEDLVRQVLEEMKILFEQNQKEVENVRITDGTATQVFYHRGCDSITPEILSDVIFGLSNNITVQLITWNIRRSIKIKFAILKKGLTSAILVSGWNVTVLNATYISFALQWTKLDTRFYIIEVKSIKGNLVAVEIVPGNATSTNIHGISPSSKYRVVVYGFDGIGQPYKTLESVVATKKV